MNYIKKIVTGILILSMVFGSYTSTAFAANSSIENDKDEIISFEDYYSSMKALYANYGVTYEVLQNNNNVVFTKGLLDEQLATAKQNLEANKQVSNSTYINVVSMPGALDNHNGDISVQSYMPYAYSHTSNVKVSSPSGMGYACFDLTLKATADAQYSTFISINSYTCSQSGSYLNYKNWDETSKSYSLSPDNKICEVSFIGRLTIEYTETKTGLLVGYTSNHNITFNFASYWN